MYVKGRRDEGRGVVVETFCYSNCLTRYTTTKTTTVRENNPKRNTTQKRHWI